MKHNLGDNSVNTSESDKLKHYISLLKATLDATVNGILVIDLDGNIVTYNRRFLEMWNIPEQVMEEREDEKAISYVLNQLKDPEKFVDRIEELYQNPSATSKDILEFKDGKTFERYSFPQKIGDDIVGRVWSFMDITEARQAQEKMNRFGQLLESINANLDAGVFRSSPDEGLLYVNDAFVDMFGYESKEEVYNTLPEAFYNDPDQRWDLVDKLETEGQFKNQEILFTRKDGTTFWGLESSNLVETDRGKVIDGMVNDITQRKKMEETLRQSEEKYRTIIENIEDGYFETDLEGNFTFFNHSLEEMLRYTREELMGMNNRDYMDEENAKSVYEAFNKVYTTGEPEKGYEWEVITKDGEKRFVEASVTLKKDSAGEPIGFRGIVRDITNRKQYEQRIEASLKEKEVLLGEIHHRVKNNLAVISGMLYMQGENTEDNRARSLLRQSQSRIHSMAMVHEMLYANQSFSSIDPGEYIEELISYISQNLSQEEKNIQTRVTTEEIQLDMNVAIPCALIINELLTNAFKYAFEEKKEGTIDIRFRKEDDRYRLEVADNGIGLPEGILKDNHYKNGGLGLFLVETFVKQIKGELTIDREDGTRFTITFPAKR